MFNSLRSRLILSFVLIVFVTLTAAAIALFARLGGYRDDLTASTLRQVAAPIYYNLTAFGPASSERPIVAGRRLKSELDAYIDLQREATGVYIFPIDANGKIISGDPDAAYPDERFEVPAAQTRGPNFRELPHGEHTTKDGVKLLYVSVPTTNIIRAQPAGIYAIIVAQPQVTRRDVWGDLAPRLLFAGGVGLAVALLAIPVIWASLFRTLGKVTGGIRAVAAGDYGQRVPESGPTEVRHLARDVNRMADSVEASQRTLREFLANVSHELKTPLTSIRGFSQAMLDGTLESPEERARAARVIDVESRRVLHLVGELLDLSRIESGQQKMALDDVGAAEILSHMADVFAPRSEETGITLAIHAPAGVLAVRADFDRIEQVLGNLIDNAFRHTPAGGRIEIGVADGGSGFAEFFVRDNGEGIAAADLPHVFDRFYRSALGEPEMPGAGLGLAIAREIVRAHGGAIRVASSPAGTEFTFTLRRTAPTAPPPPAAPSAGSHPVDRRAAPADL